MLSRVTIGFSFFTDRFLNIRNSSPTTSMITRGVGWFGGEEFIIMLPDTDLEGARSLAESLRERIATATFEWENTIIPMTVSIGVACLVPDANTSHENLIQQADLALYRAKEQGRNCTVTHDGASDGVSLTS